VGKALATLNGADGKKPVLSAPVVLDAYHTDMGLVDVMDLSQLLVKFAVFLRSGDVNQFNEAFFDSNIQPVVGLTFSCSPTRKFLTFLCLFGRSAFLGQSASF
jgi:hypothetical protein